MKNACMGNTFLTALFVYFAMAYGYAKTLLKY